MKILIIHNFHRTGSASGDDVVFKNESKLLELHGHKVVNYSVSNDIFDKSGFLSKIRLTLSMIWSFNHYKAVSNLIKKEKPNIVHIHTFFPLLSPSILYAVKRHHIPLVATLHDTRFICPCATSLRGEMICNNCSDGHYFKMVKNKCFKDSYFQSFIVAFVFKLHKKLKSFYKCIDKYICLNNQQISLLKNCGYSEKKLVKKYNFVEDANNFVNSKLTIYSKLLNKKYVVFYGRIGVEKGIKVLEKIFDNTEVSLDDVNLIVMGTGPLDKEFRQWAKNKSNITYLGYVQRKDCLEIVKHSEFVIFPSIWYEGCSMVEIEAFSLGKAIIAYDLGFSSELIENEFNGIKVKFADVHEFAAKILYLWNNENKCKQLGMKARLTYLSRFTPESNYEQLYTIYKELI